MREKTFCLRKTCIVRHRLFILVNRVDENLYTDVPHPYLVNEPIIGHFKTWGILQHTYHHDIRRHGEVFRVIAIMTQLSISNGSPLFSVEYKDSIGTVVNNKINDK